MDVKAGLQIVSDIHLEHRGKRIDYNTLLPPTATDLALCGDIGRPFMMVGGEICHYKAFLAYASDAWRHVFVILGNHCFYGRRRSEVIKRVRLYCHAHPNVHFLNDAAYVFTEADNAPFYGVYGFTLWTEVSNLAFAWMNDRKIRRERSMCGEHTGHNITAADVREWHRVHVQLFESNVLNNDTTGLNNINNNNNKNEQRKKKWIVLSHHAPRPPPPTAASAMHADERTWSGYINDLPLSIFNKDHIAVWACGHLHAHFDTEVDDIRYVSNCMGYPGEKGTGYIDDCVVKYSVE